MPDERKKSHVNANEDEQRRTRSAERPERPTPEPDTMEGPGGRNESKAQSDAADKTTRRGER